jgi:DMSO reductase iron-sulfur subunit
MIPVRKDEPEYAKLKDTVVQEKNRYGKPIVLSPDGTVSLRINGDNEVGPNPNRNKQHAFHFTADNCIGCHACEAACSEKNDLPPHLSFRSVGYVEGGTYPDYTRMNISMACNHCDDPVCLKGCPTRAYTKHPEYGAVIQDPDICFGCGYCTWVCPYNAPQLDPVKGQVEKCNMCVDRLEVGLKPACVAACVGNALDFGVVENLPAGRDQIETQIPGFPDPSITQPNIRFQQIKTLPREVTRTDSMPVKYHKDNNSGRYKPVIDQKSGRHRYWNLKRLSSRENPLVMFTLLAQASIGTFIAAFIGSLLGIETFRALTQSVVYLPLLLLSLAMVAGGLFMSTTHLGKPWRFYRGFNNLRHSPVSREGLGLVLFQIFLGLHTLFVLPRNEWLRELVGIEFGHKLAGILDQPAMLSGVVAVIAGLVALYYMYRCYRIKARPFWDHWHTAAAFYGTMLSLGAWVIACAYVPYVLISGGDHTLALAVLAPVMLAGMLAEAVALYFHARCMSTAETEGAASHYIQCTTFGHTYTGRNILLGFNIAAVTIMTLMNWSSPRVLAVWMVTGISVLLVSITGRALFYVLVIPTTMPGAFFWKNKAFEQHARDIGLAANPAVGVAVLDH